MPLRPLTLRFGQAEELALLSGGRVRVMELALVWKAPVSVV